MGDSLVIFRCEIIGLRMLESVKLTRDVLGILGDVLLLKLNTEERTGLRERLRKSALETTDNGGTEEFRNCEVHRHEARAEGGTG